MRKSDSRSRIVVALALCASVVLAAPSRAQERPAAGAAPPAEKLPPAELEKLVAPIALYPDALVIQIVTCAASPYQVKQVNEWLKAHPDLKGTAVQDAATDEGFDASFVAIVLFPQVVQKMDDQPEWTKQLGEAFSKDRSGVFAAIQRLRTQAQEVGNLNTNEQQSVETVTTGSGQQVIVIEPANPQIVYVPQYDPQIVYVQTLPTTTVVVDDDDDGDILAAGVIGFTAGVFLGAALDDDHYYGCGGWGYHGAYLCDEGWDDFYDHREDMANDFYDHREEMSEQRSKNQEQRQDSRGERQDTRSENQSGRQESRDQNQSGRQEGRDQNQAGRQDSRGERQDSRAGGESTRQSSRQNSANDRQTASGSNRASKASRGTTQNRAQPSTGTNSSAFTGYQKGSSERASSSRGKSSASRSSSTSRSRSASGSRSGGASRGGGSRGGGGRGGGRR